MADVSTGFEARIYYAVGGQDGGAWVELANVKDCTLNQEESEIDVTTRSSGGHKQAIPGLMDSGVEFDMLWMPNDPGCQAIREAFYDRDMIGMRFLDKDDGHGLQADFAVFKFTRNEQLEEGLSVTVGVKPTLSAIPPSWVDPAT